MPPQSLFDDGLPSVRSFVRDAAIIAKKSLGQNFIFDENLLLDIASLAGTSNELATSDVLEIGPGPGGLTRALLTHGARRVCVVEKDMALLPNLHTIAKAYPGRVIVKQADALQQDFLTELFPPVYIVANLPFNIASVLLMRWLTRPEWPPVWQSLTLMLQREVAHRIIAPPGRKDYGRLAIMAQWRNKAQIVLDVPAHAFYPQPKVHAAVVSIAPYKETAFDSVLTKRLLAITNAAFHNRRKMIHRALIQLCRDQRALDHWFECANVVRTERPERISVDRFVALAQHWPENDKR